MGGRPIHGARRGYIATKRMSRNRLNQVPTDYADVRLSYSRMRSRLITVCWRNTRVLFRSRLRAEGRLRFRKVPNKNRPQFPVT